MCNYQEEPNHKDDVPTLSENTIHEAFNAFVDQDMDSCLSAEFSQDELDTDSSEECDVDSETYLDSEEIPPTKLNHCRYLSAAEANNKFNETVQLSQNKYDALAEDKKPDEFDWRDEIRSQNASIEDIQHSIENEVNRRVQVRLDELDNHCEKYKYLLRQRAKKRLDSYRKAYEEELKKVKSTDMSETERELWRQQVHDVRKMKDVSDKTMNDYVNVISGMWDKLPSEIRKELCSVPGLKQKIDEKQVAEIREKLDKEINYEPDKIVDEIGEKFKKTNHINASDAHLLGSDPNMMSAFIGKYVPNAESNQNYTELLKKYDTGFMKEAIMTNLADVSDTLQYATFPANSDILSSPEKKVADVIENELRHYKENNDSMKIGRPYDPTVDKQKSTGLPPFIQRNANAEQCDCACKCKKDGQIAVGVHFDASVANDLPKSMVDKIVNIPGEYWRYYYNKNEFSMTYSFKSRTILLTFNIGELNGESSDRTPLLKLDYNNNGLGELAFTRKFGSEQEINQSGPNAMRMYTWLIQIINTFFLK